ncbi:ABC transporter permease [Actinomadura rupiterrae]|uniref:ABC transporter permease n=1 Tax=Actinomadura rupiterrae TaxID=559627 RepID=UPI0020A4CC47|nr:ABC transporter permease [Actinomadura rupiterrae]MCP2339009.1 NitT/TauT family transport system permease protein [Actinomadura rupiterrae]
MSPQPVPSAASPAAAAPDARRGPGRAAAPAPGGAPGRRAVPRRRLSPDLVRGAIGVLVFLAACEAAGRTGLIDRKTVPLASATLERAARLAGDSEFLGDVRTTLTAWALGMLLTLAVAVPAGFLIGSVPAVRTATRPFVEFLRPIPSVAVIPLAMMIFPAALHLKLVVIAYGATWPILVNTVYGLREVDPVAVQTLRTFGFGRLAVLLRVALPSVAPFVATGARVASGVALILAISVELVNGGTSGVGVYLVQAGGSADALEMIVAAAVWAGLFGLAFDVLFTRAERRLFRWRRAAA